MRCGALPVAAGASHREPMRAPSYPVHRPARPRGTGEGRDGLPSPARVLLAMVTALVSLPMVFSGAASHADHPDPHAPAAGDWPVAAPPPAPAAGVDKVVVIGIDGLMIDSADCAHAPRLRALAAQGLLARGTLAGHVTMSGPSWATALTGVWDSRHGVLGNEFDQRPFDRYPSVFTRVEAADPARRTESVATWDKIATVTTAGAHRADIALTTTPVAGDADESATDRATAEEAAAAIAATGPDLLFVHLDQVDLAGHGHGGASRAYRAAVTRADALTGRIAAAVDARAAAHPGERWTILVTADHGHRPAGGHGGQSAAETTNFVLARGPDFAPGSTATGRSIVDITPTVLDLLGVPAPDLDGHSLRGPRVADSR